jgi:L,D-transpeptidase catalytic domain
MKNLLLILLLFLPFPFSGIQAFVDDSDTIQYSSSDRFFDLPPADSSDYPPLSLFQTALAGYEMFVEDSVVSRPEVITIIDFSLQSDQERLWVIDLNKGKVLFHCLVSHGRNSGELTAENFSNIPGSYESSPGFYVTGETYIGKHGLSLKLDGLESGVNDKARSRAIVIHGADYVSDDFIRSHGRLGRSHGCPAVPVDLSEDIIKAIKEGSCLFIYAPEPGYTPDSRIISKMNSIVKT